MSCLKNALISVSDKTNLLPLAKALIKNGTRIISTGGTAHYLREQGIEVTDVETITQMKEQMGGRLKTLHPTLLGGILARLPMDEVDLKAGNMPCIDIVVVNLYPFSATVKSQAADDEVIEKIDIGGPTLIRAAAKNHARVWIVTDPTDYEMFIHVLENETERTLEKRRYFAKKAFQVTAAFDAAVCDYLSDKNQAENIKVLVLKKTEDLRYGENPHQSAALYTLDETLPTLASQPKALQGKALSYNNLLDTDNAFNLVQQFQCPACVVVKHNNPCGVAMAETIEAAFEKAWQADALSAFGGVIACNRPISAEIAKVLSTRFVEVIIAPHFEEKARTLLQEKAALRLLERPVQPPRPAHHYRSIDGGLLVQNKDMLLDDFSQFTCVTENKCNAMDEKDALFAWQVSRFVKSNAIVFAKDGQTIGIGAGQMSRVFSAKIAEMKALESGFSLADTWLASDGFIPFEDTVEIAAKLNVRGIVQPGGSKRDQEVIDAANRHGIIMLFTHHRHFWH